MLLELTSIKASIHGVPILHDVTLHLDHGTIYGLLGPNGAGKTTTIAVALGLLGPDAGYARVVGFDPRLRGREVHAKVGALPEQNGFYDWMTASEYLHFFAKLYGKRPAAAGIAERLDRVGLAVGNRQVIATFSRGMRQRLGLARALLPDPELLILDEPTNGLDPRGRREIHDVLITLAAQGTGILLCTHLLDDVERLCSRVGILVEGRTVAEGDMAEVLAASGHSRRYRIKLTNGVPPPGKTPQGVNVIGRQGDWRLVDLDPAISPAEAWRSCLFMGWPIAEIVREGGGLEELYIALTEGGRQ